MPRRRTRDCDEHDTRGVRSCASSGSLSSGLAGMCPGQALGRLADKRPFYFRARHGELSLEVGPAGVDPDGDWHGFARPGTDELVWAVAGGEDPTDGWMPEATIRELLQEHLGRLRQPRRRTVRPPTMPLTTPVVPMTGRSERALPIGSSRDYEAGSIRSRGGTECAPRGDRTGRSGVAPTIVRCWTPAAAR